MELERRQEVEIENRLNGSIAQPLEITLTGIGTFKIYTSPAWLARMCRRAARNKGRECVTGPLTIRFKEAKLECEPPSREKARHV